MKKRALKNSKFIVAIFFVLLLVPGFIYATNGEEKEEGGALEIVYPRIPGYTMEKVIFSGLPDYVNYIFRFSVILIGLVILGVLIYSGVQYLTSAGSPEKLTNAKQGIFSAILGGVILLSAVLIFNTINPQLTILELPDPYIIEPSLKPGIYLCNKTEPGVNGVIEQYKNGTQEEKVNAAKELKYIMKNDKGFCFRVNFSGNLETFVFKSYKDTVFAIPRKEYVYIPATETKPATTKEEWRYDYGIIFHERDNWKGRCAPVWEGLYNKIDPDSASERIGAAGFDNGSARSVTIFEKLKEKPDESRRGVILYDCIGWGEYGSTDMCPKNRSTVNWKMIKPPSGYYATALSGEGNEDKGGLGNVYEKARSVKIDPVGSYFAIMFSEENFKGETCELISKNEINLLAHPIGQCGITCKGVLGWVRKNVLDSSDIKRCVPCLKSMYVVEGNVIY